MKGLIRTSRLFIPSWTAIAPDGLVELDKLERVAFPIFDLGKSQAGRAPLFELRVGNRIHNLYDIGLPVVTGN
jgi:hypothetical protein